MTVVVWATDRKENQFHCNLTVTRLVEPLRRVGHQRCHRRSATGRQWRGDSSREWTMDPGDRLDLAGGAVGYGPLDVELVGLLSG